MDGSLLIVIVLLFLFLVNDWNVTSFSKSDKKAYMKSHNWQLKRQQILKRDNYKCVVCSSKDKLEVHHTTYRHLGNEPLRDLVSVCRSCHQTIHNRYGYSYSSEYPIITKKIR